MMRQAKHACLLLLLSALACSLPASAAVLQTLYLDDMVTKTAAIVHGTVVEARSDWNAEHTTVFTTYRVRAQRYYKGFLGETFEFREPGGEVGNIGVLATGAPHFQAGEEVFFFLWTNSASGYYQCIGFEQGALRVTEVNGIKVVNRSIPVRDAVTASSSGRIALAPGSFETSREVSRLSQELTWALAQAEALARQKEGR